MYLRLDDSRIIESEEVAPGVVLDYNEQNQVVDVEILGLSKRAQVSIHVSCSSRRIETRTASS